MGESSSPELKIRNQHCHRGKGCLLTKGVLHVAQRGMGDGEKRCSHSSLKETEKDQKTHEHSYEVGRESRPVAGAKTSKWELPATY